MTAKWKPVYSHQRRDLTALDIPDEHIVSVAPVESPEPLYWNFSIPDSDYWLELWPGWTFYMCCMIDAGGATRTESGFEAADLKDAQSRCLQFAREHWRNEIVHLQQLISSTFD